MQVRTRSREDSCVRVRGVRGDCCRPTCAYAKGVKLVSCAICFFYEGMLRPGWILPETDNTHAVAMAAGQEWKKSMLM